MFDEGCRWFRGELEQHVNSHDGAGGGGEDSMQLADFVEMGFRRIGRRIGEAIFELPKELRRSVFAGSTCAGRLG